MALLVEEEKKAIRDIAALHGNDTIWHRTDKATGGHGGWWVDIIPINEAMRIAREYSNEENRYLAIRKAESDRRRKNYWARQRK